MSDLAESHVHSQILIKYYEQAVLVYDREYCVSNVRYDTVLCMDREAVHLNGESHGGI